MEAYVGGSDDPVNAQVLGVSECSDLAAIDLEGDGYPFLEFRTEEINTGLDVYAAGFPLTECGGVGATYVVVEAVPAGRSFVIRVQVQGQLRPVTSRRSTPSCAASW